MGWLHFVAIFFLLTKMKPRTHEQARSIICCCCGIKDFKSKPITANLEQVVRQEVYPSYSRENEYHPNGLCGSCRTNLFTVKKGNPIPTVVRDKWNSMDYDAYRPPSRSASCSCKICLIVRHTGSNVEINPKPELPRALPAYDQNQACHLKIIIMIIIIIIII